MKPLRKSLAVMLLCLSVAILLGGCSSGGSNPTGPGALPTGVTINSISGDDSTCLGVPAFSVLTITVTNSTSTTIEYTIEPGTTFKPGSSTVQQMMLVQVQVLTVEPGTWTFCLPTYCLNATLDAPDTGDSFQIGSVTNTNYLLEIIELLRGKTIRAWDVFTVQFAIWNSSETGSLGAADRAALAAI